MLPIDIAIQRAAPMVVNDKGQPVSGFDIRIDGVWRGIYRAVQLGKFVTFTTLPVAS